MFTLNIGGVGYAVSAFAFAFLLIILAINWRGQRQSFLLILACFSTTVWAAFSSYQSTMSNAFVWYVEAIELTRNAFWLSFLFYLLKLRNPDQVNSYTITLLLYASILMVTGTVLAVLMAPFGFNQAMLNPTIHFVVFILIAIVALVLLEQLFRNTPVDQRWSIKFFCIGAGSIFAYDFYMYSDALLMKQIDSGLWAARGYANAMVVPLVAISAARNSEWALRVHVSKQFVFHSAAIVGAGFYLLAMGAGGYYIKVYGGTWGSIGQIIFLVATLILLGLLLFSGDVRAKTKVFLSKNFFHYKYDYRDEWHRLIHAMAQEQNSHQIRSKAIMVIADIVESPAGILVLKDNDGIYRDSINWNMNDIEIAEQEESSLVQFLVDRQWVVSISEYNSVPELYADMNLPRWIGLLPDAWIIVPFIHQVELIGFAVLARSRAGIKTNWEDRDLLLTAARQISSYLVLLRANEELLDAQQFDAFNRLSAYVVHDLKNIVAQLSLVVSNAAKHKENPEFMKDAIETVDNATKKMNKMLVSLRSGKLEKSPPKRVSMSKLMQEVVERRKIDRPVPALENCDSGSVVWSDYDRLLNVMEHLVHNAQQATADSGWVKIYIDRDDDNIVVRISDNGCGMDSGFIKERLFKPFQTTKGNAGMGIGVYEAREHFSSMGGNMAVVSEVGKGTEFTIQLPQVPREGKIVSS